MVCLLKYFKSSLRCHSRVFRSPITSFEALATMSFIMVSGVWLFGYGGFDVGMGVVVFDCDVSVFEIEDIVYERVEFQGGQGQGLAGELEFCLFDVVEIEVGIAECVYEFADLKSANLGCHVG